MKKSSMLLLSAAILGGVAFTAPQAAVHAADTPASQTAQTLTDTPKTGQVYPYLVESDDHVVYTDPQLTTVASKTATPFDGKEGAPVTYDRVATDAKGQVVAYHFANKGWAAAAHFDNASPYTFITRTKTGSATVSKTTPVYTDSELTQGAGNTLPAGTNVVISSERSVYEANMGGASAYEVGKNAWVAASDLTNINVQPNYTVSPSSVKTVTTSANVNTYPYPEAPVASKTLPAGSWKVESEAKDLAGNVWYDLAGGYQWVKAGDTTAVKTPTAPAYTVTKLASTTVKITKDTGIYTDPTDTSATSRSLKAGSSWKVAAQTTIGKTTWLNLGGKQWINRDDTSLDPTFDHNHTEVLISGTITLGAKGSRIYSQPNTTSPTSRILKGGSSWHLTGQLDNGLLWDHLGGHQWILASDVAKSVFAAKKPAVNTVTPAAFKHVVKINYVRGFGIAVWTNYQNGKLVKGQKLLDGTSWKVYKKVTVGSKTWYNLGGNQWIDAHYTALVK